MKHRRFIVFFPLSLLLGSIVECTLPVFCQLFSQSHRLCNLSWAVICCTEVRSTMAETETRTVAQVSCGLHSPSSCWQAWNERKIAFCMKELHFSSSCNQALRAKWRSVKNQGKLWWLRKNGWNLKSILEYLLLRSLLNLGISRSRLSHQHKKHFYRLQLVAGDWHCPGANLRGVLFV